MNATPEPVRHPWLIVARREIMAQLTSKVFWVGTLSTIGVIILAFLVSNLMAGMGGTSRVAVASDEATAVVAVAKSQGVDVEAVRVQPDALAATVADGQADAALSFDDGWKLAFKEPDGRPDADRRRADLSDRAERRRQRRGRHPDPRAHLSRHGPAGRQRVQHDRAPDRHLRVRDPVHVLRDDVRHADRAVGGHGEGVADRRDPRQWRCRSGSCSSARSSATRCSPSPGGADRRGRPRGHVVHGVQVDDRSGRPGRRLVRAVLPGGLRVAGLPCRPPPARWPPACRTSARRRPP